MLAQIKEGFPVCLHFLPVRQTAQPEISHADRLVLAESAAGRLSYRVHIAGEWSSHVLINAVSLLCNLGSGNKLKTGQSVICNRVYSLGLLTCLEVNICVCVCICWPVPTWNWRTQLFLIIQWSGLVRQGRYPFTEPVLHTGLFLPNGCSTEGEAGQCRLQAEAALIICVLLE